MGFALEAMKGAPFTEVRAAAESFHEFLQGYTLQDGDVLKQAQDLAFSIHLKLPNASPTWQVGSEIKEVLWQISNMVVGMEIVEDGMIKKSDALAYASDIVSKMPPPIPQQDLGKADQSPRSCTCHPDDSPPVPCAEKFAFSECIASDDDVPTRLVRPVA